MLTPRSPFHDATYWEDAISFLNSSISRFTKLSADNPTDSELRVRGLRLVMTRCLDLLWAQYSAGHPIEAMARTYHGLAHAAAAYKADPDRDAYNLELLDDYIKLISALSLGLLLGAPTDEIRSIIELREHGRDALFAGLAASAVESPVVTEVAHPKPFGTLYKAYASDDPASAAELVRKFLKDYYAQIKEAWFHNTHLKIDSGFVGYWAFESAAVVVIRKLDDTQFRDSRYYPAELADHARHRSAD
jgi:hypothetical protein